MYITFDAGMLCTLYVKRYSCFLLWLCFTLFSSKYYILQLFIIFARYVNISTTLYAPQKYKLATKKFLNLKYFIKFFGLSNPNFH